MFKFSVLFFFLVHAKCGISDPDYKKKPLLNTDYSGFISRDFYQVIVELPIKNTNDTITMDREKCRKSSLSERDKLVVNQLRKIALNNDSNSSIEFIPLEVENFEYTIGDFSWFLNKLNLFMEDYSDPKKCKFIYRLLEKNLYSKVEKTKLTITRNKMPPKKITQTENQIKPTEQNQNTSSQPIVPGITR